MIERIILPDFPLHRDVHHRWRDLFHKGRQGRHTTSAKIGNLGEGGPEREQPDEREERPAPAEQTQRSHNFSFQDSSLSGARFATIAWVSFRTIGG
jgi:hypothetical protein